MTKIDLHDSDCATHNEPAYPNGPCDCRQGNGSRILTPAEYTDARMSLGMSNDQLAKWLGVHRSVAYRYANGSSPIPGPVARALRLACGVKTARSRLFHGMDEAFVSWNDLYPLLET